MADIAWLMNRLKAMSIPEVMWRVSQKMVQKNEKTRFAKKKILVTSAIFYKKYKDLVISPKRSYLNLSNEQYTLNDTINLLENYDYELYKKNWHAGFQTKNEWPLEFSYSVEYKQRDDIGDARTNWELNRHFQFAMLAKNYFASREEKYLNEFVELFDDWNNKNPFLWGISWTSVMEVAIRCSNWSYAYCFLCETNVNNELLEQLRVGIINMTAYIANHYSRYSSANNHLIIEAYVIGQTGILCDYKPWVDLAIKILTRELPLQNYSDGINKELSLHYQSFYMEAMGLMMRLLNNNYYEVPDSWKLMLTKMSRYVKTCMGNYGEVIEFGDNDEGKILDLCGRIEHYEYVLGMMSILLNERYVNMNNDELHENLHWLFKAEDIESAQHKDLYEVKESVCFEEGGNTILRSRDGKILIGIDHAELGFGSIAAHGHADALSFQMYVEGNPVFIDPGTYIYHCDLESRNAFRKTENHNTVCINGKDQSEMLGAFLWGKRAECSNIQFENIDKKVILKAEHNGYHPIIHSRTFEFDGISELVITDKVNECEDIELFFVLAPSIIPQVDNNKVIFNVNSYKVRMDFACDDDFTIETVDKKYSKRYGIQVPTRAIVVNVKSKCIKTNINIK